MIKSFLSVSPFFLGAIGSLLFSLVIVRLLGFDVLGQFSVIYSLTQFVVLVSRRGMGVALTRYAAGETSVRRIKGLVFCLKRGLKASIIGIVALFLVSIFFLCVGSFDYFILSLLLSFSVIPSVYMFIYCGYMKGIGEVFKSAFYSNGYVFLVSSCVLTFLWVFGVSSVQVFAITFVITQFAWVVILSRRFLLFYLRFRVYRRWNGNNREIVSLSDNISVSNIFSSFYSIISILLVGCFVPDHDVGYFKIFTQVVTLTTFITSVLVASVGSEIANYFKNSSLVNLQKTSVKLSFMQLLAVPLCVIGAFLYFYLSGVLFIEALPTIIYVFVFFTLVINIIFGAAANWLNLTKYDEVVRKVTTTMFLPLSISFSYFTWQFGLVGATLCLLIGIMLQTMTLYLILKAKLPINYPCYKRVD